MFCENCGKELKEGEICSCKSQKQIVETDFDSNSETSFENNVDNDLRTALSEDNISNASETTLSEANINNTSETTLSKADISNASETDANNSSKTASSEIVTDSNSQTASLETNTNDNSGAYNLSSDRPDYKAIASNSAKKVAGSVKNIVGKGEAAVKGFSSEKGISPKKFFAIAGTVIVLVIILVISLVFTLSKGYETPVKKACALVNEQETDITKIIDALLPEFASDAFDDVYKLLKKSDYYKKLDENISDLLEDKYDSLEDKYGKKLKATYDIKDVEKIDNKILKRYEDSLETLYDNTFEDIIEDIEDFDNDDWEDLADSLGISKSDAKKYGNIAADFMKEFKNPKISSGYTVSLRIKLEGKDDDIRTDRFEISVLKINGDWTIMPDDYSQILSKIGLSSVSGSLTSIITSLLYNFDF